MRLYWSPGRAQRRFPHLASYVRIVSYVILLCMTAGRAEGQPATPTPQETAMARALFNEGVAFADAGDWESARDRFTRAQSLRPSSGILFNLACAEVELGRLVAASEHFRSVQQDLSAPPALTADAEARMQALAPRLSYLTVHVEGAPPDAELRVDDVQVPRAAWDVAAPIDPGAHTLTVQAAGQVLSTSSLELGEGEQRVETLSVQAPVLTVSEPVAETPPAQPTDDGGHGKKPLYKNPWLWAGVGAASATAVVLVLLLGRDGGTEREAPVMGNAGPGVLTW